MPKYQYINKAGQYAPFDAADEASAMASLSSFADRDPRSGLQLVGGGGSPAQPQTPSAPAGPDYPRIAKNAGAAGLSVNDYSALLGPTPEEQNAAKNKIANQFGYKSADDFFADAFRKPSKTTEQFYRNAYSAARLPDYITNISKKREALSKALNTVNDNPWLDEASRSGKARRLQELAYADIKTLQDEYDLRLQHVRDLVTRYSDDLGQDEKIRDARLSYLENAVKDATTAAGKNRALENLESYLEGKQSSEAEAPKTVSAPGTSNVYEYDSLTREWKLIQKGRPPTRAASGSGSGSGSGSKGGRTTTTTTREDKIIKAFNTDLTKINPKTETREALLSRLIAKYGSDIDHDDITRKVYETYPDGYESRYK